MSMRRSSLLPVLLIPSCRTALALDHSDGTMLKWAISCHGRSNRDKSPVAVKTLAATSKTFKRGSVLEQRWNPLQQT
jgi:hypothetical protein